MQAYTLVEIDEIGNLRPGTQIAYKGLYAELHPWLARLYPLFSSRDYYYHHGVYLDESEVVHFTGANKADATPRKCDIVQFQNFAVDGKLYRVEHDDAVKILTVNETLKRARAVLAEPSEWPGYQIVKNNCESFATWLTTGREEWSAQASKAVRRFVARVIKLVIVLFLIAILFARVFVFL